MSERVMGSISNSTGKNRQTVQPYQPVWMAHWMRSSSNLTAERRDDSVGGNNELDSVLRDEDSKKVLEASSSVKEGSVTETKTESLGMRSKGFGKEAMLSPSIKRDTDEKIQVIWPISSNNLECGKGGIQFPAAKGDSFREYHSISEGTSKKPLEWVKTHASAKNRSSATSMAFQERFPGSSTHIVPDHNLEKHEFDKGKAVIGQLIGRPSMVSENQFPSNKLRIVEQEHGQEHKESAGLICGRKMVSQSESDTFMDARFRKCNTSLLLDSPSMNHSPAIGQDWFQKMQNSSGIGLLPNQCIASENNDSRILHYDNNNSLHKLPNCDHDIKAMRICTTVDSVEAIPGGVPRFSQTTQSLLITKSTDVNMTKENDIFRKLITKMSGELSTGPHNAHPFFGQANRGVKLQPLSSSSNSEGQVNVRNIRIGTSKVAMKNESSAETDTMDMDFLKEERPNSGANSGRSTKGCKSDTNLSPQLDGASSREVKRQWTSEGLPDINLELPALPAAASSSETAGPTFSQTQSLEMETLLANAEQPTPKSNFFLDDSSKDDPTTRWVKRLKPSSSDSTARGTKSTSLAENNSSHDKKRNFFKSILKNNITGKEPSSSDRSRGSSKEDEHFTVDPTKKGKELLFSHRWIKRWLRNGSQVSRNKPDAVVMCEPQSSKLSSDDLQKKQFPSIAAMALMGRAMTGFQSCELRKRGSFTVWNTKAF